MLSVCTRRRASSVQQDAMLTGGRNRAPIAQVSNNARQLTVERGRSPAGATVSMWPAASCRPQLPHALQDVVRAISAKKEEPEWMLDFRCGRAGTARAGSRLLGLQQHGSAWAARCPLAAAGLCRSAQRAQGGRALSLLGAPCAHGLPSFELFPARKPARDTHMCSPNPARAQPPTHIPTPPRLPAGSRRTASG